MLVGAAVAGPHLHLVAGTPSWCMGAYPPRLGSAPLYQVVRPPDCALPPLIAYVVVPLFLRRAVTNAPELPWLFVSEPLAPANSPFSRSPGPQGPDPEQGATQPPPFTWVPLATMYSPCGWAP